MRGQYSVHLQLSRSGETAAVQSVQSDRPELYQTSQVATPSNSSNATRVSPSSLRPRDPLRRTFGDLLAAKRVGHYDSSGLVVTSAREGVCKGAQSLLAP